MSTSTTEAVAAELRRQAELDLSDLTEDELTVLMAEADHVGARMAVEAVLEGDLWTGA